ncbi:aldo/keto reductase [Micromonospora peucetia]|nr:aldo/keto reductase [Micromonospora peucetia]MCX4391337.1 aldo/keto reductase [Micromonospora peucetia]
MTGPLLTAEAFGRQGFGAMRLRDGAAGEPDRDPVTVIQTVVDAGIRMIDTADAYGNEELVGRAIRSRRDHVMLASKFGLRPRPDTPQGFDVRADPAYVRHACDASLKRLGIGVIDLYYLHHRSDTVPIEETVGAMAELITDGKVRALGLSNVSAEDLHRVQAVHPIAALQERWSLTDRGVEDGPLSAAARHHVAIVAHSPTSHGLLHQEPHDGGATAHPQAILARIARQLRATPGQVALAWVHHREPIHGLRVIPLPGTTRISHARANIAAADLELPEEALQQLDTMHARR